MPMDKKEDLLKQRDEAKKEAAQYENQVKILLNKQRDAERHARNHRLIVHGAIMEGVFPFTASMDGESLKAFLIDLSRLPGAEETAEKAQKIAPTNSSPFLTAHLYTVPVSCALPGAVASLRTRWGATLPKPLVRQGKQNIRFASVPFSPAYALRHQHAERR